MPKPFLAFGLQLRLTNRSEVLEAIDRATTTNQVTIATVNAEFFLTAKHNAAFTQALEGMSHCTLDGSGPYILLKWWSTLRKQKPFDWYPGADMIHNLFETYQNGSKSFYFIGGPEELATTAAQTIRTQFPGIKIVGAESGGIVSPEKIRIDSKLGQRITEAKPDILLVGFGAPKQELWIQTAKPLGVPVMIGVGGTLGFYGSKKRAPKLLRLLHLEWLGRLVTEPGHWKRAWKAVIIFPIHAFWWMLTHL